MFNQRVVKPNNSQSQLSPRLSFRLQSRQSWILSRLVSFPFARNQGKPLCHLFYLQSECFYSKSSCSFAGHRTAARRVAHQAFHQFLLWFNIFHICGGKWLSDIGMVGYFLTLPCNEDLGKIKADSILVKSARHCRKLKEGFLLCVAVLC